MRTAEILRQKQWPFSIDTVCLSVVYQAILELSFIGIMKTQITFSLQALHALALSNAQLCHSSANPASFVMRLTPYLKSAAQDKALSGERQRSALRQEAERLICLLPLISTLLESLSGSLASIALEMERDLLQIIGRNPFTVVRH